MNVKTDLTRLLHPSCSKNIAQSQLRSMVTSQSKYREREGKKTPLVERDGLIAQEDTLKIDPLDHWGIFGRDLGPLLILLLNVLPGQESGEHEAPEHVHQSAPL